LAAAAFSLGPAGQAAEEPAGPAVPKGTRSGKPARETPQSEGQQGRRREPRPGLDLPDLDQFLSAPGLPKDLGDAEMMTIAARFKNVEGPNLKDSRVTDAGLKHLKQLRKLRWLEISRTDATAEGVRDLKRALPRIENIIR
jgi:hypothetical protein